MKCPHLRHHYTQCTVIAVISLLGLIYLWSSSHRVISDSVKGVQEADNFANTLETDINKLEYSNKVKAKAQATKSEPAPPLTHHMHGPGNEQYATYINNLRKCLDTTNLTDYFHREKLLSIAVANVKYYTDILHKFIPHQFDATLPNHCWNDDVELVVGSSSVSGHIGRTQYNIRLQDINSKMLCVLRWSINHRKNLLPISCIPEVFLAGFPKSGSTYMYTLVTSHPAIAKPLQKETSWWHVSEHFTNDTMKNTLYMADYIANFGTLVKKLSRPGAQNPVYSVDAQCTTLFEFPKFSKQHNSIINICLLPSVLPVLLPKVKFIVVLRNPVTYLYSHFWYTCTRINRKTLPLEVALKGPDIFHDRVLERIASFHSCSVKFPLAKCGQIFEHSRPFNATMPNCGDVFISIALYYFHIQKWLSTVPRKRWLFVTMEELSMNKNQTLNRVWNFLNIPPLKEEVQGIKYSQEFVDYRKNQNLFMRNDTRKILKEFFHPYNRMLADLLGDRKFLWEDN